MALMSQRYDLALWIDIEAISARQPLSQRHPLKSTRTFGPCQCRYGKNRCPARAPLLGRAVHSLGQIPPDEVDPMKEGDAEALAMGRSQVANSPWRACNGF